MGLFHNFLMSAFTPTFSRLEPQDRPDNLSAAVMNSLSRPIYGRVAWSPLKSFVLGGITFGILPLFAWPSAFARFVTAEQQQFWHLLEWLNIRTGDKDAQRLRDAVQKNGGPSPTLWLFPILCVGFFAANFLADSNPSRLNWDYIARTAYAPGYLHFHHPLTELFRNWNLCLSVAFFLHWLNVRLHVARVNRMLGGINTIFLRQQLPPVPRYDVGIGLSPAWMIAGLIGLAFGAVWAIPAAFAGAIHQRYCRRTSSRIRAELAVRVSTALARQRPPVDVPMPHGFRLVCRNPLCGNTVAGGAAFCPRCGTPIPRAEIA